MTSSTLDRIDRRLLRELQGDARLTTAELAGRVALSASPCWRRVKRMEEEGVITGYHARIDAAKLGYDVLAFVHVTLERHDAKLGAQFEDAVARIPEVVACHNVSGQYDFLLQVVARDLHGFGEFARSAIRGLPGVKEINSSFSLKEVKAALALPVD
jgi:DNA-binding Lrp family transcriptional regulator